MRLYQSPGFEAHEFLAFDIVDTEGDKYFLRIDRRVQLQGGSVDQSKATASLASSSAAPANDEIAITKNMEDNPAFTADSDQIRCSAKFTKSRPELRNVLTLIIQIRASAEMGEYKVYWQNCWAFARTIFRKLVSTPQFGAKTRVFGWNSPTPPADIDEFLLKLMTEDMIRTGSEVVGGAVGVVVGSTLACMLVGSVALAGLVAFGISTACTIAGGSVADAALRSMWQAPFARNWRRLCKRIDTWDMLPLQPYLSMI